MSTSKHSELILDQFTRQAVPFATAPSIKDEAALRLIVEFSGAGPDDTVLDVACGPGLVVCAFARVVRHATGIDVTPAMLDQARTHAAARGGTVMVVDSAPAAAKATAFNRMEILRDPSHVRSLPLVEHVELFRRAGLPEPRVTHDRREGDLEGLITRSSPEPGDADRIRAIFADSLADDPLDMQVRREGDRIVFGGYPVAVRAARRG